MNNKINVAIAGLGRAGRFHLSSLQQLPSCHLKYVVDPYIGEDSLADINSDIKLVRDLNEALSDSDLHAVIISTPTQYHHDYIRRSLKAGKHIFTEKPLGKSISDIEECFDLAENKSLALYLGFQRRYDKNFNELKSTIERIGQIRTVKISSRDNPKPSLDYLKISGNIFHDMLIHDFDMIQYLLGYQIPDSVYAVGHAYDSDIEKLDDYDTVLVTLKYDNGLVCSIDTSRTATYGYDQRIELFAENGMAVAENERTNTVQVHNEHGMTVSPAKYSFPSRYKEAYRLEIEDFMKGIQSGKHFNVPRNECILGHIIADAAYDSIMSGKVVNLKNR